MTISETIYEQIISDIVQGKIKSEDVLTENKLVERFAVSKSPVRDALVKLCQNDILVSIPRFGYKIKLKPLKYFKEIQTLRYAIEPFYLDKYFDQIYPDKIKELDTIHDFTADKFETPIEFWKATSGFHLDLANLYGDEYYIETLKNILNKALITFSALYWGDWETISQSKMKNYHLDIHKAIVEGNKDLAISILQKDIMTF